MIFDDESKTMTFPLTSVGQNFWRGRKFLTKKELVGAIERWKVFRLGGIAIMNIVCNEWGPAWSQTIWYNPLEVMERIVPDLAEISLSYGIIYIGRTPTMDNCIVVAETPNHQTNIDVDVIDAIVEKIGGGEKLTSRLT